MRGSLEGGVVVASDWCWSISCSTAAALTRKAGGLCAGGALPDPRAGRLRARQHSQSPAGEWWWSPFFRVRKLISEPRHAAAGARLHVRIISQARKWSHGRASHVTTLVATRVGGKNYITKLSQTRSWKNSTVIVNALIFVLEVPVSVVPSFRVSDLARYYVGIWFGEWVSRAWSASPYQGRRKNPGEGAGRTIYSFLF